MKKVEKSLIVLFALIMVLAVVFACVACDDKPEVKTESIAVSIDGGKLILDKDGATVDAIKTAITVEATMSDGTKVTISDYEISGFDANAEGEQTVKVTYGTFEATFKVEVQKTVVAPTVESIAVEMAGSKLELEENNANLNAIKSAITVKLVYSDETKKVVDDYEIVGFDSAAQGEQTVTIKHSGKEATLVVVVNHSQNPVLTEIVVSSNGDGYTLEQNNASVESLKNLLVVTAKYSDGSSVVVNDYEVIGLDVEKLGEQTVTIKYGETTTTVDLVIKELIISYDYKVVINNNAVVKLSPLDSEDPNVTEQYTVTVELVKGETIKVVSSDGKEYAHFEPTSEMDGTAKVDGEYIVYFKLYADGGDSIWVKAPEGEDPDPTPDPDPYTVSVVINGDVENAIVLTESESEYCAVQYTGTFTLAVGDTIKVVASDGYEYVKYENADAFNGTATVAGEYTIYVKCFEDLNNIIYVAVPEVVDPDPTPDPEPYTVSVVINGDVENAIVLTEGESEYCAIQYTGTFTLAVGDTIKVVASDGYEYVKYENADAFDGTATVAGEYTIYVKCFEDLNNIIYVAVPEVENPDPTPVTYKLVIGEREVELVELVSDNPKVTEQYTVTVELVKGETIKVVGSDGKEYAHFEPTSEMDGTAKVDGEYIVYFKLYADGGDSIWVKAPEGEDPDPTPDPELVIKEDSKVVLVIGEKTIDCELNPTSLSGDVEFMAVGVELKVDDVVVITVDGKEYKKYQETCKFDGKVTVDGEHNFYIGNNGIWVDEPSVVDPDPTPDPDPYTVSVVINGDVENAIVLTESESEYCAVQYTGTFTLAVGDTIKVVASDGYEYVKYENADAFDGTATVAGEYTIYVKCFEDLNNIIYVAVPEVENPDPTPDPELVIKEDSKVVLVIVEKTIDCELNPTSLSGDVEFMAVGVELKVDDVVVITVDGKEYKKYQETCKFDGKVTVDGEHNFYIGNNGIWVDEPSVVDPDPTPDPEPYTVSVVINGDVENAVVLTEGESEYCAVQYTGTFTLAVGDTIKVVASDGYEYVKYENADAFDGTATVAGEYTIYVKCFEDLNNIIYTQVPSAVVVPDPDVKNITVYYYNKDNWASVNAYAWTGATNNGAWPGVAMKAVEGQDGWYSIEINGALQNIIFNCGGKQTADLSVEVENLYFNGYEWTDGYNLHEGKTTRTVYYHSNNKGATVTLYAWTGSSNIGKWPGVAMKAVEGQEGWYVLDISLDFANVIFVDNGTQSADLIVPTTSDTVYYNSKWVETM